MSLTDAPDYTQLSDVIITGTEIMVAMDLQGATIAMPIDVQGSTIAIPVDIQGQTISLDVNIVASTVTINVSVQSQAVDIKIYTPSGRWTTTSETVTASSYVGATAASPGTEATIINVTGRGRLISMGMRVYPVTTFLTNIYTDARIRVYVDGSLKIELSGERLDMMNGFLAFQIRQAGSHAITSAISLPINFVRIGTSPDRYLVEPLVLSPRGGLTYLIWDQTNGRYVEWGAHVNVDAEFFSSLRIAIFNGDSTYSAVVGMIAMIGAYP